MSMASTSDYEAQLAEAARLVAERVADPAPPHTLVWQSRSGPPQVPWLEPDVNDEIRRLADTGVESIVIVPVGFVSDHIEVMWDLDAERRPPLPTRVSRSLAWHPEPNRRCLRCDVGRPRARTHRGRTRRLTDSSGARDARGSPRRLPSRLLPRPSAACWPARRASRPAALIARFAERNARFARYIARFARESTIPRTAFRSIWPTPRAGVSVGCFGTTVVLPGVIHEARGGATR